MLFLLNSDVAAKVAEEMQSGAQSLDINDTDNWGSP